jgi:hypothetical protein
VLRQAEPRRAKTSHITPVTSTLHMTVWEPAEPNNFSELASRKLLARLSLDGESAAPFSAPCEAAVSDPIHQLDAAGSEND